VLGPAEKAFHRAKEHGQARAGSIAQREAPALGLDPGYCRRYLDTLIRYDLGPQELAGMRKYYQLAVELGLAPEGVKFDNHRPHLVESR
jgi:chorismate dehydratase